jgi:hypothetical protein
MSDVLRAFALKESAVESFVDAAVSYGAGKVLRVAELLEQGDGTVVVRSHEEADALATVEQLKEVAAPNPADLPDPRKKKTVPELREELAGKGLDATGKKPELLARLRDHDEAAAAASQA